MGFNSVFKGLIHMKIKFVNIKTGMGYPLDVSDS